MRKLQINIPELPFAAEEAMKRLRINIKFVGENTRKIMVTSSIPNEGKSSVSLYLWKMLAESGFKSLYLDLDLRQSVTATRYNIQFESEPMGVEHFIAGMASSQDIVYETNIPNAYMVPVANTLENPSMLFEDKKFAELMSLLDKDYRFIIVDTPPLINVTDGAQIAEYCDGAVLVVRSGVTSRRLVKQTLDLLEQIHCPLIGTVLNRAQIGTRRYGYGYGYGNTYGYGNNEKTNTNH